MSSEEVAFLRDQVKRLNAVLAKYQEKYPAIGSDQSSRVLNIDGPEAPWLVDKSLLSPLIAEYDGSLKEMNEQLDDYKKEQRDLRSQLDKILSENMRLTRELKECVQGQLDTLNGSDIRPGSGDDVMLQNLQQQLDLALQEKESAVEMWQSSLQEVERLERDLQDQKSNPQWKVFEQQSNQLKEQYFNAVSELNAEISSLQEELRKSKNENRAASLQVTELRKTLEEAKDHMFRQEQDRNDAIGRGEISENIVDSMRKEISELEANYSSAQREIAQLAADKKLGEEKMQELLKSNLEHEAAEYEAVIQLKEQVQITDQAAMEKEQALINEKQANDENQRLQEAINKLLDEAGMRTREEVDNVKNQCNVKMERLVEEVYSLEMESSEKQAQLERACREKKAVEAELEKLYQEGVTQGHKENSTHSELNRRACQAEKEKQDALISLESTTNQLKRLENVYKQEKSQYDAHMNSMRERMAEYGREYEKVDEDRVKYVDQINEMKKMMQQLRKEKESAERKCSRQMSCLEQDSNLRDREFEVKLQSMEDGHRHAMLEVRQLLTAQQRMSAKWKEECHSITAKFEAKLGDCRAENSRLKTRQQELVSLLDDMRKKTTESEEMLCEYTRNIKRLENRVREAEQRAMLATKQVSGQLSRERRIVQERRLLRSELDRSKLETSRPTSRNADAILQHESPRSRHGSGGSTRDIFFTNGRAADDLVPL
ncbi:sodium channel and clathrin linker 1-like isoform X2 [Lineus longissimus]|uniref:sodium channel and clathrin linker 1-like isoform X2 n=1 Tax=Lineus longissimus TaxID=88925 RepID=UPI002B4D1E32